MVKSNRSRLMWDCKASLCYVRINSPTDIPPSLRFEKVFCLLTPDKPKTKMGLSWVWNTMSEFAREGLTFFFSQTRNKLNNSVINCVLADSQLMLCFLLDSAVPVLSFLYCLSVGR